MNYLKYLLAGSLAAASILAFSPADAQSPPFNAYSISTLGGNCSTQGSLPYQSSDSSTKCTPAGLEGHVLTLTGGVPAWTSVPGTGTVTSVGLSLPSYFTVTNSPVTASGTLTATMASQTQNLVLASPNGVSGAPTFRALTTADIGSGTLPVARGGTGVTTSTGTGNTVLSTLPVFDNRLSVSDAAGTVRTIMLQTGTSNRWAIRGTSDAESGSNAGTNFAVVNKNDAGVDLNTALFIRRSDAFVGINTGTPNAQLDVNGSFNVAGAATIGTGSDTAATLNGALVANGNAMVGNATTSAGSKVSLYNIDATRAGIDAHDATNTSTKRTLALSPFGGDATAPTAALGDNDTSIATTAFVRANKGQLSPSDFGAVGDGVADDTTAVTNWLNAGGNLNCVGTYRITGAISIAVPTNGGINIHGAGRQKCKFILDSSTAAFTFTLPAPDFLTTPQIVLRDFSIAPNAVINTCAVTVASSGASGSGTTDTMLNVDNVAVMPTSSTNNTLCGIDLYAVRYSNIRGFNYLGSRTSLVSGSFGIRMRGLQDPVEVNISESNIVFADTAFVLADTWQGVSLDRVVSIGGRFGVDATTSNGSSEYFRVTNSHFNVSDTGIKTTDIWNVHLNNNYVLLGNNNALASTTAAACTEMRISTNTTAKWFSSNMQCAGSARTGVTTKYGQIFDGVATGVTSAVIGSNILEGLTIGTQFDAGTNGILLYPQRTIGVTTPLVNNATASANSQVSASAL